MGDFVDKNKKVILFQNQTIRRLWHNDEWWFSIIDVCGILTESRDSGAYWRKLKQRLKAEGSEVVTICHGLRVCLENLMRFYTTSHQ